MAPRDIRTNAVVQRYYYIVTDGTRVVSIEQLCVPRHQLSKKADAFTVPTPRVSVAGGLLADDGKISCPRGPRAIERSTQHVIT